MKKLIILCITLASVYTLNATPNVGGKSKGLNKTAAGCNATTAVIDLDINNVRAHLMNGGDMWWHIPTGPAYHEVPKGSNTNSPFSRSIWIGGYHRATG